MVNYVTKLIAVFQVCQARNLHFGLLIAHFFYAFGRALQNSTRSIYTDKHFLLMGS